MNSRLKPRELCPLHRRRDCCGREPLKPKTPKHPRRNGITYMADGREVCTPAVLKKRKFMMVAANPFCAGCGEKFEDYREVELGHKVSKGMGGGRRDDSWSNLVLLHRDENREQGSRTLADYLLFRKEKGLPTP